MFLRRDEEHFFLMLVVAVTAAVVYICFQSPVLPSLILEHRGKQVERVSLEVIRFAALQCSVV